MAEYIEREALLDEINIAPVSMSICMNVDECKGRIYERERLVRVINDIPAADVVPLRHGRWISEPGHIPHCSECGKYSDDADTGEAICCPFCGARMDGGGNG